MATITWHGHSTFSLKANGFDILIDPFFSGNPSAKTKAGEVAADFILLTHGHGDHVGDTLAIAKRTGAQVIGNFEVGNWIMAQGYDNVHQQHIGGGFQHPFGHLKLTIAFHGSSMPDGSYGGMPAGLLITTEGKRIYIAGDTALYSDMALIGQGGLDLAVLPVGDNYTMGPEDSLAAVALLRPQAVLPCHYNTWPLLAVDIDDWQAKVRAQSDARPVVPSIDEAYTI
jgi:L-ascorbate metabolism protein UlaG (beta-lactamase superfamily)